MKFRIALLPAFAAITFTAMAQEPVVEPPVQVIDLAIPEPAQEEEQIFTIVEVMPEFPGGQDALFAYLAKNVRYPQAEQEAGISGTVYVNFVVGTDGALRNVKILRGVKDAPGFDVETLRVVQNMPNWIPGTQRGKPVAVQYNLPIRFVLD